MSVFPAVIRAAPPATPPKINITAPVQDFSLPLFSKEGFRTLLVLGNEARFENLQKVEIKNMHLTLFTGGVEEKVDTVLVSAAATFYPSRQFAEGIQGVRFINDDAEMSGDRWTFDHKEKKVVLDGRVRVIFRAHINDILR